MDGWLGGGGEGAALCYTWLASPKSGVSDPNTILDLRLNKESPKI